MTTIDPTEPASTKSAATRSSLRTLVVTIALSLTMLGLGAGYGRHRFGSMSAALAYLRGDRLLVDESSRTIDDVQSGSEIVVRYGFTNWAAHPVKLLGMSSSCSCTVFV